MQELVATVKALTAVSYLGARKDEVVKMLREATYRGRLKSKD
jgi:hypothetical protein